MMAENICHLLIQNECCKHRPPRCGGKLIQLIQLLIQNIGREYVPCWFKMAAVSTCLVLFQQRRWEPMISVDFKWLLSVLDVFFDLKCRPRAMLSVDSKWRLKDSKPRVDIEGWRRFLKARGFCWVKGDWNTCFRRGCWPERRRAGAHLPSIWMMIISGKYYM